MIDLFEKGQITVANAAYDLTKFFVVRVGDLQADAKAFAGLARLVFSFANLVAEKDQAKREQRRLELSKDARIRSILDQGLAAKKKNSSNSATTATKKPNRR